MLWPFQKTKILQKCGNAKRHALTWDNFMARPSEN